MFNTIEPEKRVSIRPLLFVFLNYDETQTIFSWLHWESLDAPFEEKIKVSNIAFGIYNVTLIADPSTPKGNIIGPLTKEEIKNPHHYPYTVNF